LTSISSNFLFASKVHQHKCLQVEQILNSDCVEGRCL